MFLETFVEKFLLAGDVLLILSRRVLITLPVAVRYISRLLSANNTEGHMCSRAVSDRAAVTTWWNIPTGRAVILCLLDSSSCHHHRSLLTDKKHVIVFGLIRPDFSLRQRRACWIYCRGKRKRVFTAVCSSTLTIDLNLLPRCDGGKGHAGEEEVQVWKQRTSDRV